MKCRHKRIVLLISFISICLCGCYSKNYFIRELNKQFGKGTYTFEEENDKRYTVTLDDYPDNPFAVGTGTDWMPYEYSHFQAVFREAIYDEYSKQEESDPSLYELDHSSLNSGNFRFELKHDMNLNEAEHIYDETEKIVAIIKAEYPIYNTRDYSIGTNTFTYMDGPLAIPYILASCKDGILEIYSRENFLAYQELMQEETKYSGSEGITIKNCRSSSVIIGADTLRTVALKGFHIDGFEDFTSLQKTMVAPGEKGTSAWCNMDMNMDYDNMLLGLDWNEDTMSEKKNHVYIETANLGSEPCALKDTTVTKVIYHFNKIDRDATFYDSALYLDGMRGNISRGDFGFDLSSSWNIGKPETEEEKQKGIRYKNILVKIQSKLYRQGILEKVTDTPPIVKQMDITFTWEEN